jgi:hypothetical protein
MSFDPHEVQQLMEMATHIRHRQGFGYDGTAFQSTQGYFYPSQLYLDEDASLALPRTECSTSLASSATRNFDSPAFDTFEHSSNYSSSTAPPPAYGSEPAGLRRPPIPDHILTWLPCEFKNFSSCNRKFSSEEVDLWIDHIIERHLHRHLPSFSICWFCDDESGKFRAASNRSAEKEKCFRRRMHHIAEHFHTGMKALDIRPDFFFLDHLHHYKLISERTFQLAKEQGELPAHIVQELQDESCDEEVSYEVYEEPSRSSRRSRHRTPARRQGNTHRRDH